MLKRFALASAVYFLSASAAFSADAGSITIHVTDLRNDKGVVRVALFNSKDNYASDKGSGSLAYKKDCAPVKGAESTVSFQDVPYGDYAIKLFHDEDNSGKFLTNMVGIPKVEYGFSNNARGAFGPASYDKAKFTFKDQKLDMTIKAIH